MLTFLGVFCIASACGLPSLVCASCFRCGRAFQPRLRPVLSVREGFPASSAPRALGAGGLSSLVCAPCSGFGIVRPWRVRSAPHSARSARGTGRQPCRRWRSAAVVPGASPWKSAAPHWLSACSLSVGQLVVPASPFLSQWAQASSRLVGLLMSWARLP
jgi:hypothetical protein